MKFILRAFGYILLTFAAIIGICGGSIIIALYFFSVGLPDHNELRSYKPSISSRVFLQDGTKLCEYSVEKRYFVNINRMPRRLITAFISAEDKTFFEHIGIDVFGIARSMLINIGNIGTNRRPQGASTITQQVARMFLIKNSEISYLRKIKEMILSFRIESALSKNQILELYLNQVYTGLGTYGVAAAAKLYFGKRIEDLTIAQCAYIASLAKGANNYHPIKNKDKAIIRRNWVIRRQLEDKYITKEEAEKAVREDLIVVPHEKTVYAEYFSEEIRKELIEKYPFDSLNREGLIIKATLDPKLQDIAYNQLRSGLEKFDRNLGYRPIDTIEISGKEHSEISYILSQMQLKDDDVDLLKAAIISVSKEKASVNKAILLTEDGDIGELIKEDLKWAGKKMKIGDVVFVEQVDQVDKNDKNSTRNKNKYDQYKINQLPEVQGGIVVIENATGRILAMQGGYSFKQSKFNRATQAMRQVGSVFKPFVYMAALENGFSPNTIINASDVEIDLGPKIGIWKPKNYRNTCIDKVTIRQALEKSINTATVRVAQEIGLKKIAKISEQFGIFDQMPELFSYALGAGETTLLKMTLAYAMIANGGKKVSPIMIDYISDKDGKTIFKVDERQFDEEVPFDAKLPPILTDTRIQLIDPCTVYQMTSILEGLIKRRGGDLYNTLNITVAGKTGTSNLSKDAWFIGYTPDITVGVFVGFDDHTRSLGGANAIGFHIAFPVFLGFMTEAKRYFAVKPFKVPHGIKLRKIDINTGADPKQVGSCSEIITEAFKDSDEEVDATMPEEEMSQRDGSNRSNNDARDEPKDKSGNNSDTEGDFDKNNIVNNPIDKNKEKNNGDLSSILGIY